jgi:hypothetical protein
MMKPPLDVSEEEGEESPGVSEEGEESPGRGGGGATTHISTESSDEASSWREGGGAVW